MKVTPNYINKLRGLNKDKNKENLLDLYFQLIEKIKITKKNKNYKKMFEYCSSSIPLIEILIEWDKKYSLNEFNIKSIPVLEIYPIYLAADRKIEQLKNIEEVVYYFPELTNWKSKIEESFIIYDISNNINFYLKNNGPTLKKILKKELNLDKNRFFTKTIKLMRDLNDIFIDQNNIVSLAE